MRKLIFAVGLVTAPALAQATLQPGEWESTVKTGAMQIPNLPPEVTAAMAGRTVTTKNCITADQIAQHPERVFGETRGQCSVLSQTVSGGKLDIAMQCKGGMTTRTVGTFTPTTYTATSTVDMRGGMKTTSQVTGRRLGDCQR